MTLNFVTMRFFCVINCLKRCSTTAVAPQTMPKLKKKKDLSKMSVYEGFGPEYLTLNLEQALLCRGTEKRCYSSENGTLFTSNRFWLVHSNSIATLILTNQTFNDFILIQPNIKCSQSVHFATKRCVLLLCSIAKKVASCIVPID